MDESATETARTVYLTDYRPPEFAIAETDLTFELHDDGTIVRSRLTMTRETAGIRDLSLNAEHMEVLEVAIDGAPLAEDRWQHEGGALVVRDVPDAFELSVVNRIHPEDNTSLNGLYRSRTMFCTQCEPHGFRTITPYLDRPDVLSRFRVRIEAERAAFPVLLSNGNPESHGELDDGRHFALWRDPFPKPAYLFALVAGDLERVTDEFVTMSGRKVDIHIYVERKDLDKVDHALKSLKEAMVWDVQTYGREYDLDLFQIVAVDDFNMGAMENKGLNIFNTSAVLANPAITTDMRFQWIQAVVGHEYFHNWSGNRVTCRDWFQLSLKEGFTVYRDNQFSADLNSPDVKRIEHVRMLRTHQFGEDSGPLAHPVQPPSYQEINNFYTLTVYEKGAEVVRMQANLLGPEKFREATDLYFERFDGQAVTIEDFVACIAEVSGRDMSQFMHWYRQAGTPLVEAEGAYDADTKTYRLTLRQSCPPTPEADDKAPFVIPVRLGLVGDAGDLTFRVGTDGPPTTDTVLTFDQEAQTFELHGVETAPVPSLMRDFSAPVRLKYAYEDEDLAKLMQLDSNGFNRWDASQKLAQRVIERVQRGDEDPAGVDTLVAAFGEVLDHPDLDPALVAVMLQLPTVDALADAHAEIDLDGLFAARRHVRETLASALAERFAVCYERQTSDEPYEPSAAQIARRLLRNTALAYWVASGSSEAIEACHAQFSAASNMTDANAALTTLVNADADNARKLAEQALAEFYETWKNEPLVVNQWLALQAASDVPGGLARVKRLMKHEAFDIRNPNKVRSVIGAFCGLDPHNFHHPDGSGYRFLADQVLAVDELNPQTASRLVTPLSRWKRFDAGRREFMRAELERLSAEKLSNDVREMVDKSLAAK